MPQKCSVPFCRGNYDNGPKVSVFSFPRDASLRQKWLNAIPRKDFEPTKNSKVCELHFCADDIRRVTEDYDDKTGKKYVVNLKLPLLMENAVPSVFAACPKYFSSLKTYREEPSKKRERLQYAQLEAAISESLEEHMDYQNKYCYNSLEELVLSLKNVNVPEFFTLICTKDDVMFLNITKEPCPRIALSVVVDKDLQVNAYFQNTALTRISSYKLPARIDNVTILCTLLDEFMKIKSETNENYKNILHACLDLMNALEKNVPEAQKSVVQFLSEQLVLMNSHKNYHKYSAELLVLSSLMFSVSPHSYVFLRNSGYLVLPHPYTLRRLCSNYSIDPKNEECDENFLIYAKEKFRFLGEQDKYITLMIDEIHLKPFLDYKGGNVLGAAYNCEQAARSAHVFMVQGLRSSYKDVIKILPVKTLSAEALHQFILNTITGLESIGFNIVAVITDNNAINRRAMSFFANPPKVSIVYAHPVDSSKPLFFIIDSVHILKCIRNNWLNQKNLGQCMYFPKFPDLTLQENFKLEAASFLALKKLHGIECDSMVKYAHTLTTKALFPNNLERQNVKLVLHIFNLQVAEGLSLAGSMHNIEHFEQTANYIRIICRWWDVMNVKTIYKGEHKRNKFQEPLTCSENDEKVHFLYNFLTWLESWEAFKCDTGNFTKDTQFALKHTTYAMIEITRYCIQELNFEYVLTGKLQTDSLEDRFGRYRQLAGAQYNISLTQVYETEKKLRVQSLLPLTLNSKTHGSINVSLNSTDYEDEDFRNAGEIFDFEITVNQSDIDQINDSLAVLTYIGGYSVHAVLKKHNRCCYCKNNLLLDASVETAPPLTEMSQPQLIRNLDRGGLKYPCNEVINIVVYNYIVITKLVSEDFEMKFLRCGKQRAVACDITERLLNAHEKFLPVEMCKNGHSSSLLQKSIICTCTNIFLKNYCKKRNDKLILDAQYSKKRKVQTLTNGNR